MQRKITFNILQNYVRVKEHSRYIGPQTGRPVFLGPKMCILTVTVSVMGFLCTLYYPCKIGYIFMII